MKKLKLNTSHFQKGEVLTRSQLKNVLGGDPPVTTSSNCCCEHHPNGGYEWYHCGLSQAQAQAAAAAAAIEYGSAKWCCDSCPSSMDPCTPD